MAYLKLFINPEKEVYEPLLSRTLSDDESVVSSVREIIESVKRGGDESLLAYEEKFDGMRPESLYVTDEEFQEAENEVPDSLKRAIDTAYRNIWAFHEAQRPKEEKVETMAGVECYRKALPIEKVGLYVPGGTAPLFSTVLMLSIPAKVAGCGDITLATPPKNGKVNPAVLYAAARCGVRKVLKAGGAQAIAAMAYGTESVGRVYKIFGPGNRFVAAAKNLVSPYCQIDMVAGPSEVMVVCDSYANPLYVATDLLSQAEHGKDSQVILIVKAKDEKEGMGVYGSVEDSLQRQLEKLGRKEYMLPSLSHSSAFIVFSDEKAMEIANSYAPEHLILNTENAMELASKVRNAGSVFIGAYSPESCGDYASGTNHTLPTSGHAVSTGGVSVDSYIKKITFQRISKEGLKSLASTVVEMAEAENLTAHAEAVKVRMK